MYLFNALDRGNLRNAKTDGIEDDLHFKTNQYNITLVVFFVPYVLFAPPIVMLGKKFGPARVLPVLMLCFGSFTILGAAARNFGGMMALRWFLDWKGLESPKPYIESWPRPGMSGAAFFPLVIYCPTAFYRRGELARRLAMFYAASNIANAFTGLLAFGVFQIKNTSLDGSRYLFLIEGSCTFLFSFFAYWYLS
ncbi:uncharacterized protein L3040_006626 [Drepanopeziza brunnea f. sp. 'multigermtubi']|uniref:uncharacterized protein n=1 Tax=Drepanopeziza brunnea f. sp. 'multigermtubi' TaxID=698441 RepID=UPI002392FEB2|nr:hypothetical protein L3040_006626 [Drepanopeziza brunnea f. sp. 'multigermtubi']